jgi:ribosomal protein L5
MNDVIFLQKLTGVQTVKTKSSTDIKNFKYSEKIDGSVEVNAHHSQKYKVHSSLFKYLSLIGNRDLGSMKIST